MGDGKPGSSNVARSLGWKPGAAVLAMDAGKAFVPAAAARLAGASDGTVGRRRHHAPCSATSRWSRGAAPPVPWAPAYAMDAQTMTVDLVPLVGGSALHHHAEAVSVTAVALPLISLALHRRTPARALGPLALITVLFRARLRGIVRRRPAGHSPEAWWYRFWLDRDTKD